MEAIIRNLLSRPDICDIKRIYIKDVDKQLYAYKENGVFHFCDASFMDISLEHTRIGVKGVVAIKEDDESYYVIKEDRYDNDVMLLDANNGIVGTFKGFWCDGHFMVFGKPYKKICTNQNTTWSYIGELSNPKSLHVCLISNIDNILWDFSVMQNTKYLFSIGKQHLLETENENGRECLIIDYQGEVKLRGNISKFKILWMNSYGQYCIIGSDKSYKKDVHFKYVQQYITLISPIKNYDASDMHPLNSFIEYLGDGMCLLDDINRNLIFYDDETLVLYTLWRERHDYDSGYEERHYYIYMSIDGFVKFSNCDCNNIITDSKLIKYQNGFLIFRDTFTRTRTEEVGENECWYEYFEYGYSVYGMSDDCLGSSQIPYSIVKNHDNGYKGLLDLRYCKWIIPPLYSDIIAEEKEGVIYAFVTQQLTDNLGRDKVLYGVYRNSNMVEPLSEYYIFVFDEFENIKSTTLATSYLPEQFELENLSKLIDYEFGGQDDYEVYITDFYYRLNEGYYLTKENMMYDLQYDTIFDKMDALCSEEKQWTKEQNKNEIIYKKSSPVLGNIWKDFVKIVFNMERKSILITTLFPGTEDGYKFPRGS